jgi:hypothetical protein
VIIARGKFRPLKQLNLVLMIAKILKLIIRAVAERGLRLSQTTT